MRVIDRSPQPATDAAVHGPIAGRPESTQTKCSCAQARVAASSHMWRNTRTKGSIRREAVIELDDCYNWPEMPSVRAEFSPVIHRGRATFHAGLFQARARGSVAHTTVCLGQPDHHSDEADRSYPVLFLPSSNSALR
jgi:hypothetical protein